MAAGLGRAPGWVGQSRLEPVWGSPSHPSQGPPCSSLPVNSPWAPAPTITRSISTKLLEFLKEKSSKQVRKKPREC